MRKKANDAVKNSFDTCIQKICKMCCPKLTTSRSWQNLTLKNLMVKPKKSIDFKGKLHLSSCRQLFCQIHFGYLFSSPLFEAISQTTSFAGLQIIRQPPPDNRP